MKNGSTPLGTFAPNSDIIGAGGWLTRFDEPAADGTLLVGADTNNAYSLAPGASRWVLQLRPGDNVNISDIDLDYPDGMGAYDVAIARSNSAVRAIICMGYIWFTTNGGTTYTRAALSQRADVQANGSTRYMGKPLAIDPANPAHQIFASPTGVIVTTNTWTSSSTISTGTLPVPTSGQKPCVVFDRSSAVTGGITQGIYIFIPGSGLYRSTNGGTSWAAVASCPRTTFGDMKISAAGRVFLCGNADASDADQLSIYTGSAWLTNPDKIARSVAISPHTANRVYAFAGSGYMDVSTDNGVTWSSNFNGYSAPAKQTTNIGWQDKSTSPPLSMGNVWFDPLVNQLWMSAGVGVWKYDGTMPTAIPYTMTWKEWALGIENMVAMTATAAPNGDVGISVLDRGAFIFRKEDLGKRFQSNHGVDYSLNLQHSQMVDYAPEDPDFWVASFYFGGTATGFTTDRGATWTRRDQLKNATGGAGGGIIAVLSKDIWIQGQTNSGATDLAGNAATKGLYLTKDRGLTWSLLTLGANTVAAHPNYYVARRNLIKDRFTPGRCFFLNRGADDAETGNAASIGCYQIDVDLVTGTPTIERRRTTYIESSLGDALHVHFAQVDANTFLFGGGYYGTGLRRSTDRMATWTEVTGTDNLGMGSKFGSVTGVAVGKAAPGSSFQTIWVIGWRMDSPVIAPNAPLANYGLWYSTDNGATWTRHSQFPGNRMGFVNDLVADPSRFGRVVICFSDIGALMIDYDYTMRLS